MPVLPPICKLEVKNDLRENALRGGAAELFPIGSILAA